MFSARPGILREQCVVIGVAVHQVVQLQRVLPWSRAPRILGTPTPRCPAMRR
jgi:hypothetical protein